MLGRVFTTLESLLREGRAHLADVDNASFVREDDEVDYQDDYQDDTTADRERAFDNADAMDTVPSYFLADKNGV
jgi:hypothetical protein